MSIKQKLSDLGKKITNKKEKTEEKNDALEQARLEYWLRQYMNITKPTVMPHTVRFSHYFNKTVGFDTKVDEFIHWYQKNYEDENPNKLRNFIEKMAVWYELRYPDYEVNRKVHCTNQKSTSVSDVMFNQNRYINKQLEERSDARVLDWDEFYNAKSFIHSLPENEQRYFDRPEYPNVVYWYYGLGAHVHLTKKGCIEKSYYMDLAISGVSNDDLEGKHIKDIVKQFKEKEIAFPKSCEFERVIQNYDNRVYLKEEMLNCVMYRIIERGGNRIGPRRAFMFAKEFRRDINIPMIYGIDTSDPNLRIFINEYLKAGGSKDLVCYIRNATAEIEFSGETATIAELLKENKYTEEENNLHQRLASVLASQIDSEQLQEQEKKENREQAKQLRIERKLEKSRKNK